MSRNNWCFLFCVHLTITLICVFLLASCGDESDSILQEPSNEGLLSLNFLAPTETGKQHESPIDALGIVALDVEVIGIDIDKPIMKSLDFDKNQNKVTLNVPEGKNRVILITGKDKAGVTQLAINGYVNVKGGKTVYTEVNWQTTTVGEVLKRLMKSKYDKIEQYDAGKLQALVNATVKEQGIEPLFINTEYIVKYVMDTGKNPSKLLVYMPVPITGKVLSPDGKALGPCAVDSVFINHPPFQTVTTDANGEFRILPGVSPGVWNIKSGGGGNIAIQVKSDGTIVPTQPVLINKTKIPVQTGIVNNVYCDQEFCFRISCPTNWTMRNPNSNSQIEASSLIIIERNQTDDTAVYLTAQSNIPAGVSICDEADVMLQDITKEIEKEIADQLLDVKVETEPVHEIIINGTNGCETMIRMMIHDPKTNRDITRGILKVAFLQSNSIVYTIMLLTISSEDNQPTILYEFDRILNTFQTLGCQ